MLEQLKENLNTKRRVIRVGGILREVVTIRDETGAVLSKVIRPLMLEFYPRDMVQVVVGATLLAIPVSFTEEVWKLSETLPTINIVGIFLLSIFFLSTFIYYNSYREHLKDHWGNFLKRVISTYLISLIVVGVLLFLIDKAPLMTDFTLALKRAIIVALPASMSAAVADMLK